MSNDNCVHEAVVDYQKEYYRLTKENALLQRENTDLKETVIRMCKWLFTKGVN
jgi:hypothetical protein